MGKVRGTFVVPRSFDPEAKRFATIVNDSIAQIKGEKEIRLDAAVTFRDLIDTGIAKRDIKIGASGNIVGTNSINLLPGDEEVLDTPAVPTGLSANGAFQNIIIDWDNPTFFGFSHIEIWAATSNSFANRSFVGQTTANVFTHQVGTNQTRYYWIRHVNTQGVAGPFNSTTGTQASTTLINTADINDGLITAAKLVDGAVTEVKIATSAITETKISSDAVTSNKIAANAVVADKIAANSVTASKMVAGTITAASGIIGDLAISSAKIIDGAIINAKIADAAIDDAKIANLSATKITSDQIDTARIDVSGLITAGGIIVGSDLSTNGSSTIHGGNITTNTIAANKLTITPLESGQAAADVNNNATEINGGKISTNTITADKINVTDLALEFNASTVSGSTIGGFNNNQMRLKLVGTLGTEPGVYQVFCRVFGSNGEVKTLSIVAGDGTYGAGSSFELRSDFAYANNSSMNVPIADQGSAQYHSGQSQFWSAIDRFQSTSHMVQKDFAVRKISNTSRTLRIYILAQGNNGTRFLSNVQFGVYRFSEI